MSTICRRQMSFRKELKRGRNVALRWLLVSTGRALLLGILLLGLVTASSAFGEQGEAAPKTSVGYLIDVPPQPDLIVQSISTDVASPVAGEDVDVTVTVKNQGASAAGNSFYVEFYRDRATPPSTFEDGDFWCYQPRLAAGTTATCTGPVSYAAVGTYQMWAQVDSYQEVSESDEANNVLGPQDIEVGGRPDLVVESITTNPVSPPPGATVDVTVTLKNRGGGDASNNFYVEFYRDRPVPPTTEDDGDFWCDQPGLAAGAAATCTVFVSYAAAGTYQMWAQVDSYQEVSESDEANNVLGPQDFFVVQPDLIVESVVTDPVSPAAGQATDVTVTVRNQGTADATGIFWVDFYKDLVDPPGIEIADFECKPTSLAAGATYDCLGQVIYSAGGTYQMWAQVDIEDQITESDETNNVFGPQNIVVTPVFNLTVTIAGAGSGSVNINPPNVDCDPGGDPDCIQTYLSGELVDLLDNAGPGSTFAGWSGDPDCEDGQVTMDSDKTCTATFDLLDITAPSIPQNLLIIPIDVDGLILFWDASTDGGGSGVAGYEVYDTEAGVLVADTALTSFGFLNLPPGNHSYYVKAYDVAENVSDRSRFAAIRLPVRFDWQSVDISGSTFAANPAGATATASFIFEGDSVSINYGCGLNTGIFEVSIDGAVVDTVDAYCSTPDFNAQKTYATGPGGHSIEVRPTGDKNPSSSYYWTLLDSFEVAGETYEEDDGMSYTWQTVDISGSTFSANPAGSTASSSFTYVGDSVSLDYGCGLNTGIFDVEIDGVLAETVDAYCSTPDFSAQKTYATALLGTHTITVRPTGNTNPSSSYYWTLIGSFEVSGSIYQAQALPPQKAEALEIPESRLSKLLQRLPQPIRERIEKRLEQAGGIASAETIVFPNSERLRGFLDRVDGKRDKK